MVMRFSRPDSARPAHDSARVEGPLRALARTLPTGVCLAALLIPTLARANETPLPFSAASTPLASQVLEQQWSSHQTRMALDWRYSFVSTPLIRRQMAATANRLSAEIELIAARYAVGAPEGSSRAAYVEGLHAWQRYLDQGRQQGEPRSVLARLPGQLNPLTDMRDGPRAIRIAPGMVIGACQAPRDVVILDASGVHQRQWSPGLTLDALIDERRAADSLGQAARASLVTPQGQVLTRPIASWNRLTRGAADLPVAPGASLVIHTPGIDTAQQWVNEALPQWLASRLPGENCHSWQLDAASLPSADDEPTAPGTSGSDPQAPAR